MSRGWTLFLIEGLFVAAMACVVRAAALPSPRLRPEAEAGRHAGGPADASRARGPQLFAAHRPAGPPKSRGGCSCRARPSSRTWRTGYAKLGARNRADAVARALQSGLIEVVAGEELPSGPPANGATPNDRYAPPAVRSRIAQVP